jgi:hypothetical protein
MARIRTVKPDYWKSESIARLTWPSRLLFIALWSYVDDNGVGLDNEKLIAAEILPLEDDPIAARLAIRETLDELSRESRIVRYTVGGRSFLAICGWHHQKIDRPNKPRYPLPDEADGGAPDQALTCGYRDQRETLDESSRDPRDIPSSVPGDQGSGEQGIRDQGSGESAPPDGDAEPALLLADTGTPRKTLDDHFEEFWRAYPKRKSKGAARTAWDRARKRAPIALILEAAPKVTGTGGDPRFIPHAATWLNRDGWLDEPDPEQRHGVTSTGEIDVEAILGRDLWQPPTPPGDIHPGTPQHRDWLREQWAEHHAERRREAEARLARRNAS